MRLKKYFAILLIIVMAISMSACENANASSKVFEDQTADNAVDALKILKDGNKRYVEEKMENYDLGNTKREALTKGQKPFAVVVTCSDSRVVPEYIFDQGMGDVFVIRVAGNVIDTDEMASIEYGVEHLGASLVVVLGHESCGAVTAAVEADAQQSTEADAANKNISALLEKIQPSVKEAKAANLKSEDEIIDKAIDLNIETGVKQLEESSEIIKEGIESGKVQVVGAKYLLDSGEVTWFE